MGRSMMIDPDRLTLLVWRSLFFAIALWLLSGGLIAVIAYRSGYAAGFDEAVNLQWG